MDGKSPSELARLAMQSQTPYQTNLQKAGEALKVSDLDTALEVLTKTNHKLLDQLNVVQQKVSGNSSKIRRAKAELKVEVRYCHNGYVALSYTNLDLTAVAYICCPNFY